MLDVIIRGVTVLNGTGADGFVADVGLRDGRIAVVGSTAGEEAAEAIDGAGLVRCPGFIDPHTHYDAQLLVSE